MRQTMRVVERRPSDVLAEALEDAQELLLESVCGRRWTPARTRQAPFVCPRCSSASGFARRGWRKRPRRFQTKAGTVQFRLAHVACRECGKVFAPLLVLVDLQHRRRADELTFAMARWVAAIAGVPRQRQVGVVS